MRRVLFVHNGPLYRSDNGEIFGTHFTETVKQRYLQLGEHVTFLMREERLTGDKSRYSHIDGNHFSFVSVPDLMSPLKRVLNHRNAIKIIDREVRAADLLVARIPSLTARLAIARARAVGTPYLTECVACNWDALWNYHWKAKLAAPWYYLAQKRVMRASPYAVYVTENFLQRRYPTSGQSVAISDVEIAQPDAVVLDRRLHWIRARDLTHRPLRLVTVADVSVPYKGQADVMQAMIALSKRGIQAEYHLIGGGDQDRLRSVARRLHVRKRAIFHGSLQHSQVLSLLDDMDIYVQPSRQEGLPRAVVEAMSRGLPCAGARTGGIPELIDPDMIFPPGDIEQMVDILIGLSAKDAQARQARNNFQRAGNFNRDYLATKRARFYKQFLNDNFS